MGVILMFEARIARYGFDKERSSSNSDERKTWMCFSLDEHNKMSSHIFYSDNLMTPFGIMSTSLPFSSESDIL